MGTLKNSASERPEQVTKQPQNEVSINDYKYKKRELK